MRILMLNYEYPPLGGGAAPVTKELAEELVKLGHEVDVVTMAFKGLKEKEEVNGVNVYRVPVFRRKQTVCQTHEMFTYCISANYFLSKLLKERKYDINHTHFIIPTGVISYLKRKKIPYIITSHGSDVPGYNPDRFGFQHKLIKPMWNKIVENATCITTPTEFLKNLILDNFNSKDCNPDKVKVIPNGIHPEKFSPKKKERKILVVSRLFERKGVQYVIEAMRDIKDYRMVICGNGPYKKHLENQIDKLRLGNNVRLLGWVSGKSLLKEYETSSIFVLPSSAENFPVVLLEAMAAGCAVVTTNTTGCPEVVGDAGLLVRPMNTEDIRDALNKLINDDRLIEGLGMKARKRVEENFELRKVAKMYKEVYECAIKIQNRLNK